MRHGRQLPPPETCSHKGCSSRSLMFMPRRVETSDVYPIQALHLSTKFQSTPVLEDLYAWWLPVGSLSGEDDFSFHGWRGLTTLMAWMLRADMAQKLKGPTRQGSRA